MEVVIFLFLLAIVAGEYLIIRYIKEPVEEIKEPAKEPHKLSKEDKKKQEELRKNFNNLMNYDYNEALKKKE